MDLATRTTALALPIPAAANAIGISRSALFLELKAGRIERVKVGARTIVPVASLQRWLEARRIASAAESHSAS